MSESAVPVKKPLLKNCLGWFLPEFRASIVSPIETLFPNYPLPGAVQSVVDRTEQIRQMLENTQTDEVLIAGSGRPPLFKQMLLRYRRFRAEHTEDLREKTFDAEFTKTLDEDINSLDAVARLEWFQNIDHERLPRLKDFLPVQYIEQLPLPKLAPAPRQYYEKFHVLQAPTLFLPDLGYFRAKCEIRDVPLAIAFLDIDDFKRFNEKHTEVKVDRNLLPRFMQAWKAMFTIMGTPTARAAMNT